jgi:hypothetical protein
MELYTLRRGDRFKIISQHAYVPIGEPLPDISLTYEFHDVDDMFASCYCDGKRYRFAAWTVVELIE